MLIFNKKLTIVKTINMKQFISVLVLMDSSGKLIPKQIIWEDKAYVIDKVIDVKRAASLKAGGIGVRFRVVIDGQIRDLFLDDYRWFIEK